MSRYWLLVLLELSTINLLILDGSTLILNQRPPGLIFSYDCVTDNLGKPLPEFADVATALLLYLDASIKLAQISSGTKDASRYRATYD